MIAARSARGATFHVSALRYRLVRVAAVLFTMLMYGLAETLAAHLADRRSTSAPTPVVAILPWFFAGALFPISALPGALTAFAKVLPLTHAMALCATASSIRAAPGCTTSGGCTVPRPRPG